MQSIPSLPEYVAFPDGTLMRLPHGPKNRYGGKRVRGSWDGSRYIKVFRGRTYKVARLICEAYHGPAPFPGAVCMHLDEDARNNTPDNLRWGTQRENLNAPGFREYARKVCRQKMAARALNPAGTGFGLSPLS